MLILAFVTPGGTISGEPGGGMESVMVEFLYFILCLETFFLDERPGRREKIRLDLKNCNVTWSLYTASY